MAEFSPTRLHPRSACERPLRFILGKKQTIYGLSRDVSDGGLGVRVPHRLEPGRRLTVEIADALGNGSLLLAAIVRWNRGPDHGLELVAPSPAQLHVLRQLARNGS